MRQLREGVSEEMKLKVKKVRDNAILPTRGSEEAAGIDLYACIENVESLIVYDERHMITDGKRNHPDSDEIAIPQGYTVLIPTGIACDFPEGYFGMMFPRSSVGTKRGLVLANTSGILDNDYKGEILMAFKNTGHGDRLIYHGDRLAQMILLPYVTYDIVETDTLTESERGEGGFGSTGK